MSFCSLSRGRRVLRSATYFLPFFYLFIFLSDLVGEEAGKAMDRLLHTFKDRCGKQQRPDQCGADSLVCQGSRHSAGLRGGNWPLAGGNNDQPAVQLGIF